MFDLLSTLRGAFEFKEFWIRAKLVYPFLLSYSLQIDFFERERKKLFSSIHIFWEYWSSTRFCVFYFPHFQSCSIQYIFNAPLSSLMLSPCNFIHILHFPIFNGLWNFWESRIWKVLVYWHCRPPQHASKTQLDVYTLSSWKSKFIIYCVKILFFLPSSCLLSNTVHFKRMEDS